MQLTVISPEKTVFQGGSVELITVPGKKGQFTVLENHAPIISALGKGDIIYKIDNREHSIAINSGLLEIHKNNVTICIEEVKN
jgi:F-type H+-transporting ATPase subunit epsilon